VASEETSRRPSAIVLVTADPRSSHRANEAIRIALGVVAGEIDVTVVLVGGAAHLLAGDTDDLVDGDDIEKFRSALARLGIPFHVEKSAIPTDDADWNPDGHRVIPVDATDVARLLRDADRSIVF
jgi:sulfur relay (sulfurtransferase) DsrF/TusC family protein